MKFATVEFNHQLILAVLDHDRFISLSSLGFDYSSMNELIEKMSDEQMIECQKRISNYEGEVLVEFALKAPIPYPKQDILCLGQNYLAHAEESSRYKKEAFSLNREAVYFSKRANEVIGHLDLIDSHSDIVSDLDYECELAAVIRKDCYKVSKDRVRNHLFGFTVFNDISARTIQTSHKQWYFGKSLDTFCVMGPVLVTIDEFEWPLNLNIQTKVNGELRQNGNTKDLIFDLEHIVHELSSGMTLKSGTIIATGTPAGVGMGFVPPKFLKTGDLIECFIENIGILTNEVK